MDLEICWLDEDGGGSMVLNTVEFDVEKDQNQISRWKVRPAAEGTRECRGKRLARWLYQAPILTVELM